MSLRKAKEKKYQELELQGPSGSRLVAGICPSRLVTLRFDPHSFQEIQLTVIEKYRKRRKSDPVFQLSHQREADLPTLSGPDVHQG